MERTLKIFMACAIGAFVGTIVALELNRYFWWIGLLVGGFVGYLSYEFKKIIQAVPVAYRAVRKWQLPSKKEWKAITLITLTIFSWIVSGPIAFTIFLLSIYKKPVDYVALAILYLIALYISMCCGVCSLSVQEERYSYEEIIKKWKNRFKRFNLFSIYFYWFPRGIWWCLKSILKVVPKILFFSGRFIKTLIILIHSDIRLLCGIDAAIGTAIGYFAGSAVVGFFAGGLTGVVNYELISKKLLKLQVKNS